MAAACLGIAPEEHVGPAIEIEEVGGDPGIRGQPPDPVEQRIDREIPVAGIETERERAVHPLAGEEPRKQRQRQVVDDLEPEILEHAHGGRPPGAGGAGDEKHPAARVGLFGGVGVVGHVAGSSRPHRRYCRTAAGKAGLSTL
jgi:hypothetical protein